MPSEIRVDKVSSTTSPYTPVFSTTGEALSHRNMIINGAMQVYQRGSLSITQSNNGGFALDRFRFLQNAAMGQWVGTMSQDPLNDADIATTGQTNALKVLTTTVENAVGADEVSRVIYKMEGQDCQRLLYGTSAARSATLSFWAKSTVAAVYAVNIYQVDGDDTITKTYTLAANTWTKVSITIPGNTLENIANDNTVGLWINFMLIAGGDYTSADGTSWGAWNNTKFAYGHTASSISNPWGTNASDAWYITGVQFELGTVATPFEHRIYQDELRRCQRYYYKIISGADGASSDYNDLYQNYLNIIWHNSNFGRGLITHPVTMRVNPSFSASGNFQTIPGTDVSSSDLTAGDYGGTPIYSVRVATSGTTYQGTTIRSNNDATAYIAFDAEL